MKSLIWCKIPLRNPFCARGFLCFILLYSSIKTASLRFSTEAFIFVFSCTASFFFHPFFARHTQPAGFSPHFYRVTFIFQRPHLLRSLDFYLALSSLLKYRVEALKIIFQVPPLTLFYVLAEFSFGAYVYVGSPFEVVPFIAYLLLRFYRFAVTIFQHFCYRLFLDFFFFRLLPPNGKESSLFVPSFTLFLRRIPTTLCRFPSAYHISSLVFPLFVEQTEHFLFCFFFLYLYYNKNISFVNTFLKNFFHFFRFF